VTATKFEQWGIVELMGHQQIAGRLTEEVVAGANLLRVDIPTGPDTFRTAYYGPSAIYALHVTAEAESRAMADAIGAKRPAFAYTVERKLLPPAPASPRDGSPYDDEDDPL